MKISFWKKTAVCSLAGILGMFAIHTDVPHRLPAWLAEEVVTLMAVGFLVTSLLFIIIWQYRENRKKANSDRALAFWQGVIVYSEALIFFRFGFLKLFGLHMNSSLVLQDFPAGAMSGYHLMDYFFSMAPQFKLLIGCLQIAGAGAILFRKTRWLGIFILIPIIVNIFLMDIFYQVGVGITLVAFALLLGLVYLLWQDKERLIAIFFNAQGAMPKFDFKNKLYKNALRIASVAITMVLLLPSVKPLQNANLLGKYTIKDLAINEKKVAQDLNNDSLLTDIYFDENETCVLRYNDYRNIKVGKVMYDNTSGKLMVIWRYPKSLRDTSFWNLSKLEGKNTLGLSGRTGKETLQATLIRTPLATVVLH